MMLIACGFVDFSSTGTVCKQKRGEIMFQSRKSANRLEKKIEWEKKQGKSKKKKERQKSKKGEKNEKRLLQNKEPSKKKEKKCMGHGTWTKCDCGARVWS